jgi:hypothetical protein
MSDGLPVIPHCHSASTRDVTFQPSNYGIGVPRLVHRTESTVIGGGITRGYGARGGAIRRVQPRGLWRVPSRAANAEVTRRRPTKRAHS